MSVSRAPSSPDSRKRKLQTASRSPAPSVPPIPLAAEPSPLKRVRAAAAAPPTQPNPPVTAQSIRPPMSAAVSAGAQRKKMVIQPFKVAPKPPAAFEASTMAKLEDAVRAVHRKQHAAHTQEELYRAVESLCVHKLAEPLFQRLHALCNEHIEASIQRLGQAGQDTAEFLQTAESTWTDHSAQMLTIRSVFLYLDRTFVITSTKTRSLWDLGLQLFRQHLTSPAHTSVLQRLVFGLLQLIEQDRKGEHVNRSLLKTLIRMFGALEIYADEFEGKFVAATLAFYRTEGDQLVRELSVPDYLAHVSRRLQQEGERVLLYLDESTRRPLMTTVETQLIKQHTSTLIEKGFSSLVSENRSEELGRMYTLFGLVFRLEELRRAFLDYAKQSGEAIVGKPREREKELIPELLALKERLDGVHRAAFAANPEFGYALREAFEHVLNAKDNRPAELLAQFVDLKLKSGAESKGLTSEELDRLLDQLMVLFRLLQAKDIFQAHYRKHLAKRLLLGKSASRDAEMGMIARIKAECGSGFTKKLEGMFRDIELSGDLNTQYQDYLKQRAQANEASSAAQAPDQPAESADPEELKSADPAGPSRVELSVQVLTTGSWPEYVTGPLRLPPEVNQALESFKDFYVSKHSTRKLAWDHANSSCILKAHFPKGRKELACSAQQASVLLLFNEADGLTAQQIKDQTQIAEDAEVARVLESLCHPTVPILLLDGKPAEKRRVKPTDKFTVNAAFKNQLFRIKLNAVQLRETKQEAEKTTEQVLTDRMYAIDACVVRIMKTRKTLPHSTLMSEVLAQIRFKTEVIDIKKRIQSLIEREYLERDKDNSQVYNYLA